MKMPTQRTLLLMIVGLVVMLSFSIGYIAGKPAAPQSTVQALTHSERVNKGILVQAKKNDPVKIKTGSSYNAVYAADDGVIFPAQSKTENDTSLKSDKSANKQKFVFRKLPKPKRAYSWRRKKEDRQNERETRVEQGDGFYIQPQQRQQPLRPRFRQPQPVQPRYYMPTPPQSGYGMRSPYMNYNYPMFPRTQGSYMPYGR